jgi:hypothetical protein
MRVFPLNNDVNVAPNGGADAQLMVRPVDLPAGVVMVDDGGAALLAHDVTDVDVVADGGIAHVVTDVVQVDEPDGVAVVDDHGGEIVDCAVVDCAPASVEVAAVSLDTIDGEGIRRGTKIIIPDSSTLVSLTDPNPNSTLSPSFLVPSSSYGQFNTGASSFVPTFSSQSYKAIHFPPLVIDTSKSSSTSLSFAIFIFPILNASSQPQSTVRLRKVGQGFFVEVQKEPPNPGGGSAELLRRVLPPFLQESSPPSKPYHSSQ